jgi:arylsulfatase A-like enzyme
VRVKSEGEPKMRYKAVLAALDAQVGRLLDGLKGTNTLMLFLGDNGPSQPLARAHRRATRPTATGRCW